MADLILKENIEVETNHGHCEIHLNFGSITKLKREDAVDVLVISAFPGIYLFILATYSQHTLYILMFNFKIL